MKLINELCSTNFTEIHHENREEQKYNAPHHFSIKETSTGDILSLIDFQEGPVKEVGVNGIHNEDLIAIVIERLKYFQNTDFKCRENEKAIEKLEECLMWLRKRTLNRQQRNVDGTSNI